MTTTRGVLYVHSAKSAMCAHVEWAVEAVLGERLQRCNTADDSLGGHAQTDCEKIPIVYFLNRSRRPRS